MNQIDMPIKNYTTKVPASRSIEEIQKALLSHGAVGFQLMYEKGTGRIESLKFMLELEGKKIVFQLPVDWRAFQRVLKKDRVARSNDDNYCYRVAWRVIRDWVLAQMALYETEMAAMPQIFLPYAMTTKGITMFESVVAEPSNLLIE